MTEVEYVRCGNCSFVYDKKEGICPSCASDTPINESINKEKIFNICD